jgi:hypothetical protein
VQQDAASHELVRFAFAISNCRIDVSLCHCCLNLPNSDRHLDDGRNEKNPWVINGGLAFPPEPSRRCWTSGQGREYMLQHPSSASSFGQPQPYDSSILNSIQVSCPSESSLCCRRMGRLCFLTQAIRRRRNGGTRCAEKRKRSSPVSPELFRSPASDSG